MTALIHPTAYIASNVKLGENVSVGPFAVIEAGAVIGANSQIGAHAVVHGRVKMGQANVLHPHAVLGGLPQDLGFKAKLKLGWKLVIVMYFVRDLPRIEQRLPNPQHELVRIVIL